MSPKPLKSKPAGHLTRGGAGPGQPASLPASLPQMASRLGFQRFRGHRFLISLNCLNFLFFIFLKYPWRPDL